MSKSKAIRILYMEDDPGSARLFQKRLEQAGYVVDIARDGEESLAMYETGSYDVVAVDQTMPVHDGLEVLRFLASRGPLPPTIMVTGTGNEQIAVEAMKLGTSDYIVKDVEGEYLKLLPSAIERALRQQRLAEEEQRAERLLQALNQAALAMGQALTPEEIFAAVAEEFKTLDLSCVIFLTDESQTRLFPRYLGYAARAIKAAEKLVGLKTEDFSMPVETVDLYREVVWERNTVFLENAEEATRQILPEPVKRFAGQMVRMLRIPRAIAVPLIVEDKVIGVLSVQSDDLTENDVPAITAFAHQMAAAWRKGTLMQKLERSLTERKRAESKLQEAERRFQTLLDNVRLVTVGLDQEGNVAYANPHLLELAGYTLDEVLGKDWFQTFIPERDHPAVGTVFSEILEAGIHPHYENPILTREGEERLIAWNNTLLLDESGNPVGTMSIGEDITERKRAEEALRESEEKYRTILENIEDGYFEVDIAGNFTFFNDSLCKLLGYPKDELMGMNNRGYMDDEDASEVYQTFNTVYRTRKPAEVFDWEVIRKDGTKRFVEASVSLIRDPTGEPVGFRGVIRDITARKRAEEALRESEEKYRTILENIEDGYFEVDIAGNFTFFNDSLCKLLGYPKDELMGMNNRGYMDDEDASEVYQTFNTVYRTRKPAEVFDWEVIRKDGTKRFVEASVSLIRDPTGKHVGFRGVVRDITERKRTEEDIRQRTTQLEALQQVGLELTAQLNLDALLRSIVSRAIELLGGTTGGIDLYQPERDVLEWTASISPNPVPGNPVIRRGEGLSGKVWETGKPLIVDDYQHWEGQAAVYKDYPFAAIVGVPVRWGDKFLGVLQVHAAPPRTFTPADAELLSLLATQAAIAIRNVRMYEAEQKRVTQLTVVNQVARQAASILDPDRLLQEIVAAIQRGFEYHTVSLFLLDEAASEMERVAMSGGFKDVAAEEYRQAVGVGMIGWTAETGQPLLSNDVSQEPRYIPGFLEETSAGSELCVPLRLAGRVIGVLDVQDTQLNAFDETDLTAMETLADQIAVAIENARLYEQAQQELTERKRAEEALRVSEERFALAVRGSNDGLWDWDIQNNSLYWSPRFKELLGYADDELEVDFDTFESHLHPDDREHTGAAIEAHLKDRGLYDVEQRLRTKSGEYRWFRARGQALWDEAGNPVRMIGFTTDMTERKRAEAEISRRNRELAALNSVAEALSTSLELQDILDRALSRTVQALGFAGGLVALADECTGDLVLFSYTDLPRPFVEHLETHGLSGSLCEFVYREGKILGLGDLHEDAPVEVSRLLKAGLQSYMGAPIVHKDRALGTFCLFGTAPHPVSEADYALLTAIGQQIGVALENGRLYEQARQRVRELQLLHEVGTAAASGVRLEETLQATVKALAAELGDLHVGIALLDQESGVLYQKAAIGYLPDGMHGLRIPSGKGITDWVVQHGEPALVPDVRLDPRYYEEIPDIRSELCVPLVAGSQVIGVLNVESPQPNTFTDDDQRLLSTLASNLAVLIEQARLFEETQRRVRELQLLHEVGMAAASGVRLEETLQAAAVALASQLESTHVALMLLEPESGLLHMEASVGYPPDAIKNLRLQLGEGITGWVAQHGEPALVPDVRLDPRYVEGVPDVRSELCVPMRIGRSVIGVLNVESPQPNAFTDDDQRLLNTLASNLAVLVERARLFEEVEAVGIELQQRAEALEEANVRLQELDRLKSQFLANMSHELRTPLNSVIGFSEVLIDGFVGQVTPDQKECLENIRSSGHHLLSLINDILDLSKIEAGRMELEQTAFDVTGLLAEVQMTVAPMIQKKSQVLTIEQADDLPPLTADRFRVKQVLLNLLSNSYKFTPVEGHITLSCCLADPATMLFSIADTGIGIKPEDQEIVFEEFRQADGSAAREMTGTGLGLAISKRLIEMHGGRIWVESEYGHGATFSILLPLAGPPAAEPDAAGETAPPSGNKTVLVVEDDHQFSDLLAFYLRQEGYTPVPHYNGVGVLDRAHELRPAFITLDIMLPDQDGWEVLRALKSDPQTKDIPVLIISALEDGELAFSLGAVDYLIKPIRREDLHRLLDRLAAPDPLTRHVTVLAVDDDPGVIKLLQQMLPAESYTLLAAYDGKQGLTLARGEHPDVILLDLLMPGMSGFEVLEKLRADAETVDIPVIVLTAKDVSAEERELLDGHIQGLMRKSGLTPQSILAQLRRLEALRQ